eukprot:TRINITY_DN7995_c0_g1_i1.p1 TRINITY_DN7995_c0_g1~~TRINITY_DN7995_c0_g1_i1.p1  ORF type:complete len:219 (-),score=10.37 TRINITY_DN7995_c0_g1_i1:53-709(-)
MLDNILPHPVGDDYMDQCQAKCEANEECDGWVYRYPNDTVVHPECYLKSDLPIDLVTDSNYITGLNIETNQCDCICGDCYPGNKYHYAYIEDANQFTNPLYIGSTLYSYSCDFALFSDDSGDLMIQNLVTQNILKTISASELTQLEASKQWNYPVRMILDGPVLMIVDDDLSNTKVYAKPCVIQTDETSTTSGGINLGSSKKLGRFLIFPKLIQYNLC